MKEFIYWYAYIGMETEGRLDMYQPMIYKAVDAAEAMWMYRDWLNKTKQDNGNALSDHYKDLDDFRERNDITGWGWNCRELK